MHARDAQRARHLEVAFTLTPSEWEHILAYQGGVCFVCREPQKPTKKGPKRLATDHSHDTGQVRGLLCNRCNALLGKLENAFKRYGLGKVLGFTFVIALRRLLAYLEHPPVTEALGRVVVGYKGKVGTKEYRKWARKRASV
jgi:hypothetical protein